MSTEFVGCSAKAAAAQTDGGTADVRIALSAFTNPHLPPTSNKTTAKLCDKLKSRALFSKNREFGRLEDAGVLVGEAVWGLTTNIYQR